MTDELALANTDNHPLMQMLHSPATLKKFELACGRQAGSVMINIINAANMNPTIWECEPQSVVTAALNVSALGLSLAPGVGQACILPFNKNKKVGNEWKSEKRAQAVIMLRGVKDMAMRTNKYRVLNAFIVREGQTWEENQMTGIGRIEGRATSQKAIGYGAYLLLYKGYEATVYKTKDEILAHAMKYSPTWDKQKQVFKPGSRWIDNFDEQALKTVMKDLIMNHGEISAHDRAGLEMIENVDNGPDLESLAEHDADVVDGAVTETEPEKKPTEISPEEEAHIRAGEVKVIQKDKTETTVDKLDDEHLKYLAENSKDETKRKAATGEMAWRALRMAKEEQTLSDLGY